MKIADGIYMSSNPIASHLFSINCYLLTDGDDTYLFDTGWPQELADKVIGVHAERDGWLMLMELFAEAGRDPKQLSGIIVSHYHPDHSGYVPQLQAYTGAPLLITELEIRENELLADRSPAWIEENRKWYRNNGVSEDQIEPMLWATPHYTDVPKENYKIINDGDIIPIGRMNWQVIWTPGHSWGHICLWEKEKGVIMTGDHILKHDTPIVMSTPALYKLRTNPLGGYLFSLHRMTEVTARIGLSAHGEIIDDFQSVVARLLNHHNTRYDDILLVLQDGACNAYEIACSIPWMGRRKKLLEMPRLLDRWLAFTETVAHLRSLEERGLVECFVQGEMRYWRLTGRTEICYDGTDPRLKEVKDF